ncbi:outer membrane beta-barrel protein, partial [Aquimarina agarilytica]|uniref:outer membrane beta-barrel protein n=1 Tax=Aquimarina agarilytica TaxID=1087449 RepID=UPI00028A18CC
MRIFIFFITAFLSLTTLKAQVKTSPDFELGGIGGFNLANVVGADASNNNGLRVGLHLGGYAQFDLQNSFGFRPELHLFSVKGTSSGGYRSIYMDFPLLATYELAERFKAIAGIQPSLLLSARVDDGRGRINNQIRRIDFGFVFGGWY